MKNTVSNFELKRGVFKVFCYKHLEFGKNPPNPLYDARMCGSCYKELGERISKRETS